MSADRRNRPNDHAMPAVPPAGGRGNTQQRLGILRNPNRAPLPPPRRATLMGKWPSLRSSRRAQSADVNSATLALKGGDAGTADRVPASMAGAEIGHLEGVAGEGVSGVTDECAQPAVEEGLHPPGDARASNKPKIDIARLMAEVEELGEKKSGRSAYGAALLAADAAPAPPGDQARRNTRAERGSEISIKPSVADDSAVFPPLADAVEDAENVAPTLPALSGKPAAPEPAARPRRVNWALAGLAALGMLGFWLGG